MSIVARPICYDKTMNIKDHSQPHQLERYSFLWTETRLVIAAVALLMGGPLLYTVFPIPSLFGLLRLLLTLGWLISGFASGYLFYRWYFGSKTLFGHKKQLDTIAFLVSVVSGVNLGLAGLFQKNLGMSIFSTYGFWVIAGIAYLVTAAYLFRRWKESGEKIF